MDREGFVFRSCRHQRRRSFRYIEGCEQTSTEGARLSLNLPNAITIGRILVAPLIAALPFINSPFARIGAFVAFVVAAVSDYFDGMLARTRNLVTDLGSLLDPLADKVMLFATLIPMFVLMSPPTDPLAPGKASFGAAHGFAFQTPFGPVGLPWWVLVIVLG